MNERCLEEVRREHEAFRKRLSAGRTARRSRMGFDGEELRSLVRIPSPSRRRRSFRVFEGRSGRGNLGQPAMLFEAALAAPQKLTPRWMIYADRGGFGLNADDPAGHWLIFREAVVHLGIQADGSEQTRITWF